MIQPDELYGCCPSVRMWSELSWIKQTQYATRDRGVRRIAWNRFQPKTKNLPLFAYCKSFFLYDCSNVFVIHCDCNITIHWKHVATYVYKIIYGKLTICINLATLFGCRFLSEFLVLCAVRFKESLIYCSCQAHCLVWAFNGHGQFVRFRRCENQSNRLQSIKMAWKI